MKKVLICSLLLFVTYSCDNNSKFHTVETTPYSEGLTIFKKQSDNKNISFYIKNKNGNIINIENVYKFDPGREYEILFRPFKEGTSAFEISNPKFLRVGFINSFGKIIIKPNDVYDDFNEGIAVTKQFGPSNRKMYFINKKGEKILGDYFGAYKFSEGLAPVWINAKISIAGEYKRINYYGGKWGYINKNGKFIIKPQFDHVLPFSENFAPVLKGAKWFHLKKGFKVLSKGKWGYISKQGKAIIKFKFDEARPFSEGLAAVLVNAKQIPKIIDVELGQSGYNIKKNGKWGFINKKGIFKIKPVYDRVYDFKNGIARVYKNNKEYYLNKNGEIIKH